MKINKIHLTYILIKEKIVKKERKGGEMKLTLILIVIRLKFNNTVKMYVKNKN